MKKTVARPSSTAKAEYKAAKAAEKDGAVLAADGDSTRSSRSRLRTFPVAQKNITTVTAQPACVSASDEFFVSTSDGDFKNAGYPQGRVSRLSAGMDVPRSASVLSTTERLRPFLRDSAFVAARTA